jgi:anti-sigma B factor antagonist
MQLDERMAGDVAIITVTGDITLNKGGDVALRDKVRSLLQQGQTKLVVDLGNVSYVDSAGLGELVQAYATAKKMPSPASRNSRDRARAASSRF